MRCEAVRTIDLLALVASAGPQSILQSTRNVVIKSGNHNFKILCSSKIFNHFSKALCKWRRLILQPANRWAVGLTAASQPILSLLSSDSSEPFFLNQIHRYYLTSRISLRWKGELKIPPSSQVPLEFSLLSLFLPSFPSATSTWTETSERGLGISLDLGNVWWNGLRSSLALVQARY